MKKLTVAICTYNREQILISCIKSLFEENKNYSDYKLLVIDNNSKDNTKKKVLEIASKYDIEYVLETKQGLSNARNRAFDECKTELIAFVDDDVIFEKNYIKNVLEIFKDKKVVCAGGKIFSIWNSIKPNWYNDGFYSIIGQTNYGENLRFMGENEFPYGGNMIFRLNVVRKIGKFDPSLGMIGNEVVMGEEVEFCSRIKKEGYGILYIPNAVVGHRVHEEKLNKDYINNRWIQEGKATGKIINNMNVNKRVILYFKRLLIVTLRDYPMIFISNLFNKEKKFYWFAKKNRSLELMKNIKFK